MKRISMEFTCLLILLLVPFLTSTLAKAEGGCPKDFFPVGGGYCRNIICPYPMTGEFLTTMLNAQPDESAVKMARKYGRSCKGGTTRWGDNLIPMLR